MYMQSLRIAQKNAVQSNNTQKNRPLQVLFPSGLFFLRPPPALSARVLPARTPAAAAAVEEAAPAQFACIYMRNDVLY